VIELFGLIFLYFIIRFNSKKDILALFTAISLSGLFLAVYGLIGLIALYPPSNSYIITGGFQNSGPYAGYLSIAGSVSFGMYLFSTQLKEQLIYSWHTGSNQKLHSCLTWLLNVFPLAALASILIMLAGTHSRAAWTALLAGFALLILYKEKNRLSNLFQKEHVQSTPLKALIITLLSLLSALGFYKLYLLKPDSADGRLLIWKVSSNMIKESPFFGVGLDQFKAKYMNAQAAYFDKVKDTAEMRIADNTYYAFNEILQLVVENGLIALLLFIITAALCITSKVEKENRYLKVICLSVALGVFCFGMFSYPMQILPIKMVLTLIIALLANLDKDKITLLPLSQFSIQTRWLISLKTFSFCIGVILINWIFYETSRLRTGFKNWQYGLTAYDLGEYQKSIYYLKKSYPILNQDGDFLMNYGKALALNGDNYEAKIKLQRAKLYLNHAILETTLGDVHKSLKEYGASERAYKRAASMVPNRFYPEYLMVKLYQEINEKDRAYKKAKDIVQKDVKISSAAVKEILQEMNFIIEHHR
jgi:O-antigen ligase